MLQIHTVGVGVAIGQSCMLLSAGARGKRYMLPHATGAPTCLSTAVKPRPGLLVGCSPPLTHGRPAPA